MDAGAAPPPTRPTRDAERTRAAILAAARAAFAAKGLAGARVDEIAAAAGITKATLYHHFPTKDGLFTDVLAQAYRGVRDAERALDLDGLAPAEALAALVRATFDYDNDHPDFVRLVLDENLHRGAHIARLPDRGSLNRPALDLLRGILSAGEAAGVFRPGLDPLELHYVVSALCFFSVSNRHTFHALFAGTPEHAAALARRREAAVEAALRFVLRNPEQHFGRNEP
jgi:AcrR family transcriptional regulator